MIEVFYLLNYHFVRYALFINLPSIFLVQFLFNTYNTIMFVSLYIFLTVEKWFNSGIQYHIRVYTL